MAEEAHAPIRQLPPTTTVLSVEQVKQSCADEHSFLIDETWFDLINDVQDEEVVLECNSIRTPPGKKGKKERESKCRGSKERKSRGSLCSAPKCFSQGKSFFRFPVDTERRRCWIVNCGRDSSWIPTTNSRLCEVILNSLRALLRN
jgi:hypothetical protein